MGSNGTDQSKDSNRKGGSGAPDTKQAEPAAKVAPKPKTEPKYFIHSKKVIDGVVIAYALFTLAIARYFRPGFWSTIIYAAVGLPIGIALSFLFYMRQRKKAKLRQLVRCWPCSPDRCLFICQTASWGVAAPF
jgi:hypothetical protein